MVVIQVFNLKHLPAYTLINPVKTAPNTEQVRAKFSWDGDGEMNPLWMLEYSLNLQTAKTKSIQFYFHDTKEKAFGVFA